MFDPCPYAFYSATEQLMKRGKTEVPPTLLEQRFGLRNEATMQRVRDCNAERLNQIAHAIFTEATHKEVLAD